MSLKNLKSAATQFGKIEIDEEAQAIILGMSIGNSAKQEPMFTLDQTDIIERALVEDGIIDKESVNRFLPNTPEEALLQKETLLFKRMYANRADSYYTPKGDWLTLANTAVMADVPMRKPIE